MIVVSDTSPITALPQIDEGRLLPELFGEVIVQVGVQTELLKFHETLPDWLEIRPVQDRERVAEFSGTLDLGESEAISLAMEISADRLLIDENKGRSVAQQEGNAIIGLVGVVILARKKALIPSAAELFARLEATAGMYLSTALKEQALKSVGE